MHFPTLLKMAKYKSIVEIRGSIDDLVFYNLNGIPVVRKKSGFNKNDYASNPKYAKVRENSSEFGYCSKSGKMFRMALASYLKDNPDKYLYQKFAKVMTQIKDLDRISARGQRQIPNGLKTEGAYALLRQFRFGEVENMEGVALRMDGLFGIEVKLTGTTDYDSIELVSLNPNFQNYFCESHTESQPVNGKQKVYEFQKVYDTENVLYFLVLKKGDTIKRMGFV